MRPRGERYRPDLTLVPPDPKMWCEDHVYADQTLLVVEVVAPSSVVDDHDVKPKTYAAGRAPPCLVIDPFARKARLPSQPTDSGCEQETGVVLGRPFDLPAPWNLTLDTAALATDPARPVRSGGRATARSASRIRSCCRCCSSRRCRTAGAARAALMRHLTIFMMAPPHRRKSVLAEAGRDSAAEIRAFTMRSFLRHERDRLAVDECAVHIDQGPPPDGRPCSRRGGLRGTTGAVYVLLGALLAAGAVPLAVAGTAVPAIRTGQAPWRTVVRGQPVLRVGSVLLRPPGLPCRRGQAHTGAVPRGRRPRSRSSPPRTCTSPVPAPTAVRSRRRRKQGGTASMPE